MSNVRLAETDEDIARGFGVMQQLRPHLQEADFVATVRRLQRSGFHLALVDERGRVVAAGGFRFIENLFSGRILYVDDLVTDAAERSRGHGRTLLHWLIERARAEGCQSFELDSGVQRFDAHRFYFTNRMVISSHHFRLAL
jgi:GNAT superfamily N-acetyltransferase